MCKVHIFVLIRGYLGDVHGSSDGKKFAIAIKKMETLSILLSPARFSGECLFAYRHFKKVPFKVKGRSEEHTSELQSRQYLVCRLLLEKKNKKQQKKKKQHKKKKKNRQHNDI